MPKPILVLDFDGTVCISDDPARIYAEEMAAFAPEYTDDILRGLSDFLEGNLRLPGVEDAFEAVFELTKRAKLKASQLTRAYVASRERLEAGEGQMAAPKGLVDVLQQVRSNGVHVVLLTNAPEVGALSWLEREGLMDCIDVVETDAGKPRNMQRHLRRLLREHGDSSCPEQLLSIGDVWANDIAPALELGAHGFYIDRFSLNTGPSCAIAQTFPELYPDLLAWAEQAHC